MVWVAVVRLYLMLLGFACFRLYLTRKGELVYDTLGPQINLIHTRVQVRRCGQARRCRIRLCFTVGELRASPDLIPVVAL